jgi:hypothetical protein
MPPRTAITQTTGLEMATWISESRVAIAISVVAAAFTILQWSEAEKANALNEENLVVDVQQNDDPNDRVGTPVCMGNATTIPLTWRVNIFNNSAQPVTLQSSMYVGFSSAGFSIPLETIGPHGPIDRKFPRTIAARGFDTLIVTVPVKASVAYAQWLIASGMCTNHTLDLRQAAGKAGFTSVGARPGEPVNAGVSISFRTADGKLIQREAEWVGS